jgi:pimeloyl-ACP methyl ester carboxylesterase
MLPILGVASGVSETRSAFLREGVFREGFLRQWTEASSPTRPALVFVPGFLTEGSIKDDDWEWREELTAFGRSADLATFALHWPSGTLARLLLPTSPLALTTLAFSRLAAPGAALAALLPLGLAIPALSPMLGVAPTVLTAAFTTWKSAVSAADRVAAHPDRWLGQLGRPVITVGHSLGGRIVLRASAAHRGPRPQRVIAMAPAVQAGSVELDRAAAWPERRLAVFHSEADWVLWGLFRAGEMTLDHALGYEGIREGGARSVDVSEVNGSKTGHTDYARIVRYCVTTALEAA